MQYDFPRLFDGVSDLFYIAPIVFWQIHDKTQWLNGWW